MKKFIKLINDERNNCQIASQKAYATCSEGAEDIYGSYAENHAGCSTYAYDKCHQIDLAACINGAHDYCESYQIDTVGCYGPGVTDGNPDL